MSVTRTQDGNMELIVITDDAGADIAETITFAYPVEIVRIKMKKPAAGTFIINHVTASGPTTVLASATLGATDETYFSNDSNMVHRIGLESLTITSTGSGAGTSCTLSAQNLLSEEGRDF